MENFAPNILKLSGCFHIPKLDLGVIYDSHLAQHDVKMVSKL